MPRHEFWVIVSGAVVSAFRAREREDLLPTLKQLQRTQPDAALKWFQRNRLWDSPAHAAEALERRHKSGSGRGRGWRPGGSHVDPRARYQLTRDEKRARFKKRQRTGRSAERPNKKTKD
jgi:hypothetical protein